MDQKPTSTSGLGAFPEAADGGLAFARVGAGLGCEGPALVIPGVGGGESSGSVQRPATDPVAGGPSIGTHEEAGVVSILPSEATTVGTLDFEERSARPPARTNAQSPAAMTMLRRPRLADVSSLERAPALCRARGDVFGWAGRVIAVFAVRALGGGSLAISNVACDSPAPLRI
jgi:hypothetical protein